MMNGDNIMKRVLLLSFLLSCILLSIPFQGKSVTTQYFEVNSFEEFNQGEMEFAVISSRGQLHPGIETKEWEAEVEGIWDIMVLSQKDLLLATGNTGKLLRFKNNKLSQEYDTGKLAITALARDDKGTIYFSAIPKAVIYKRDEAGDISVLAEMEVPYVWCLAYDESLGLVAGTGPEGKIFTIDDKGEAKELVKTSAEHVMCLFLKNGIIYAGTADPGMLLKISGKDNYSVEHSFDEEELRRIIELTSSAEAGNSENDILIVAVNSQRVPGPKAPPGPPLMGPPQGAEEEENEEDEKEKEEPLPGARPRPARRIGPGRLNSAVYEIRKGKAARNILTLKGGAILDLAADGRGNIYAATDQQGKVYMIHAQDHAYEVAFDFKPQQVLSLAPGKDGLEWIGTGMPGGLEMVSGKKAGKAVYFSEVFDAEFPARWGKIWHEPEGQLIKFETRSGNTQEPDEAWSGWELAGVTHPFQIKSPPARYLQVKVSWPPLSNDFLSSFRTAYTILNQPHYIEEVSVLELGEKAGRPKARLPRKPNNKISNKGGGSNKEPQKDSARTITWKVDNPDGDELTYELFYKPEGQRLWIKFPLKEELTKSLFKWETESIPDEWYRVKVVASDYRSNQPGEEFVAERESDPFIIDNRRPDITDLKVSSKARVSGKAEDSMSYIARFEYSLDGGDWIFFMPEDEVFDEKHEGFEFTLKPLPEAGLHTISVRAIDAADNLGAKHIEFTIK
jgi:hypothetical protein